MVEGLRERDPHLVSKLCCNAVLWVPWTAPASPTCPVDLENEGKLLHHAQLICKPFKLLLRVVFVLDADPDEARPVTLFATDPEMAPEQVYRIHVDRFQIEFNFRDAKQYLGLAACQARTGTRHPFHVNAVLAALAWTRLELRHVADRALEHFSMANVKPSPSWNWSCGGFSTRTGWAGPCQNTRRPCSTWAQSSRNRPESTAHPARIRRGRPHPDLRDPRPTGLTGVGKAPIRIFARK